MPKRHASGHACCTPNRKSEFEAARANEAKQQGMGRSEESDRVSQSIAWRAKGDNKADHLLRTMIAPCPAIQADISVARARSSIVMVLAADAGLCTVHHRKRWKLKHVVQQMLPSQMPVDWILGLKTTSAKAGLETLLESRTKCLALHS